MHMMRCTADGNTFGKKIFSMFSNVEVFSTIHRSCPYLKSQRIEIKTILPIPSASNKLKTIQSQFTHALIFHTKIKYILQSARPCKFIPNYTISPPVRYIGRQQTYYIRYGETINTFADENRCTYTFGSRRRYIGANDVDLFGRLAHGSCCNIYIGEINDRNSFSRAFPRRNNKK